MMLLREFLRSPIFPISQGLGFFCQSLALNFGIQYAGTLGASLQSFITTASWCLMTSFLLMFCYVFSQKSFNLLKSSLFVSIYKYNLSLIHLYFSFLGNTIQWRCCFQLYNVLLVSGVCSECIFATHVFGDAIFPGVSCHERCICEYN